MKLGNWIYWAAYAAWLVATLMVASAGWSVAKELGKDDLAAFAIASSYVVLFVSATLLVFVVVVVVVLYILHLNEQRILDQMTQDLNEEYEALVRDVNGLQPDTDPDSRE